MQENNPSTRDILINILHMPGYVKQLQNKNKSYEFLLKYIFDQNYIKEDELVLPT
ncbi:MAG: hypothetical protein ACOCP4_05285 [Candidatus Woesearchaeota archaeon]